MYLFEFIDRFARANQKALSLKMVKREERRQLYDEISPTHVSYNRDLGTCYVQSIDVAEYAVYIADLTIKRDKEIKLWLNRAKLYSRALMKLSDKEQSLLHDYLAGMNSCRGEQIAIHLKEILETMLKEKSERDGDIDWE